MGERGYLKTFRFFSGGNRKVNLLLGKCDFFMDMIELELEGISVFIYITYLLFPFFE